MRVISTALLSFLFSSLSVVNAPAQEVRPEASLRVYLDCDGCDEDHFRREVTFVNYVRDRELADVHALITKQGTEAGGARFTLEFLGRRDFLGLNDQLEYSSSPVDTDAVERDGLTHTFRLGLIRYVARTPEAARIVISYAPSAAAVSDTNAVGPEGGAIAIEVRDPWKAWVFRMGAGGSMGGEQLQDFLTANGSFNVSKETEEWKVGLEFFGQHFRQNFEIDDSTTVTSTVNTWSVEGLLVRSVGDHWGVGFLQTAESSTFSNYDLALRAGPAVEYNIFPYSISTRRQLRFLASIGVNGFNYIEETLFGKLSETLADARLNVSLDFNEPWGDAIVGVEVSQYLGQPGKNRVSLDAGLGLQVFNGFGISVSGGLSRVRDQINLPAGEATPEEILLQQRELATDFRFSLEAGITYTFGSIYSNVVNPRFGS